MYVYTYIICMAYVGVYIYRYVYSHRDALIEYSWKLWEVSLYRSPPPVLRNAEADEDQLLAPAAMKVGLPTEMGLPWGPQIPMFSTSLLKVACALV